MHHQFEIYNLWVDKSLFSFFRLFLFACNRRKYGIALLLVIQMLESYDVFVVAPAEERTET